MPSEGSGIHRDNDELAGEEFSREISAAGNSDSLADDDVPELKWEGDVWPTPKNNEGKRPFSLTGSLMRTVGDKGRGSYKGGKPEFGGQTGE